MFDQSKPKSVFVAYLWWFLLGTAGIHKFYLGRPGMAILYACTLGFLFVGVFVDLFTLPAQVRAANARLLGDALYPPDARAALLDYDEGRLKPREIDAMIDRYKNKADAQPAPAPTRPRAMAAAGAAPQFGRRASFGRRA